MRYFSKRYKTKINTLLHLAKVNDLPLGFVLDMLTEKNVLKQDERYKRRDGQRIVWDEADICCSTTAFPLETLKGKRLNSLAVCFTLEQFHALEEYYGHCPENIAVEVTASLSLN
ncbi:hypothetical protein [Vibrio crassostreae]|uniref:hypothetical protein n=1 Tax=Vibrio crassostreae TaxID=246167 RepID=UPI001B305C0D|nr:hypothetical protein [Vibrio crassostreae]